MSAENQDSASVDDLPAGRRTRILLESVDEDPLRPTAGSSPTAPSEPKNEAPTLQRLPPRVELSPAIANMLAALNQEKKPTLYWDKIKVIYSLICKLSLIAR